jgi:sugar (pentulose or hexulose) kinase
MSDDLLLAVDAGTGSCRAALFAPDGGQVAIAQRPVEAYELFSELAREPAAI